ncbi:MAG: glycosyltransferase family 9 protein [Planctomycetota bacterium]
MNRELQIAESDSNSRGAIRNSLFLHAGALGDFVLTLHVAAAVRAAFPETRIATVARCPLAGFAAGRGPIDTALDPDCIGLHHLYGSDEIPTETAAYLRRFDVVINFLAGPESRVAARLSGFARCAVVSVDPAPQSNATATHITQQWLDALGNAGFVLQPVAGPLLSVAPAERRTARAALGENAGRPVGRTVVCHPGSGGQAKCCPLEVLEQALGHLQLRGDTVLWMVGPTEMEWYGLSYVERLSRTAPVLFEESLPAAAYLLTGADAYIGYDAGMTHLAAALGLPTVAMFGPTDPRVWRPLGPRVTVVRFDASGASRQIAEDIIAATAA